jgi:hypothetical protein
VEEPRRLPGQHARLIEEALCPGERILRLLICPIWASTTRPFGIQAPRASHAFCLTDARLIVSRDYHRRRVEPTVFSIGRDSLIGLEFGGAILMSWLALYMHRDGGIAKEGFYFPWRGNHLVADLLRTWRADWPLHDGQSEARPVLARPEVFRAAGYSHERLFRPLLLASETGLRMSRRPPIWGSREGWFRSWPVGLAHWGTLLLTDRAFFYVWSQPPLARTGYVFDYNLLCFSSLTASHVRCQAERAAGVRCVRLLLTFGGEGGRALEILFPEEQADLAVHWEQEMAGLAQRRPRVPDLRR